MISHKDEPMSKPTDMKFLIVDDFPPCAESLEAC